MAQKIDKELKDKNNQISENPKRNLIIDETGKKNNIPKDGLDGLWISLIETSSGAKILSSVKNGVHYRGFISKRVVMGDYTEKASVIGAKLKACERAECKICVRLKDKMPLITDKI